MSSYSGTKHFGSQPKRFLSIYAGILLILLSTIFFGCSSGTGYTSNSIEINNTDKKVILEYIETKTNDIYASREGKVYSAFSVLGTGRNRVYIWLMKEEYLKVRDKRVLINGVSMPVVLYIKPDKKGIKIISHKYSEDGMYYSKNLDNIFPDYIINTINTNYDVRVAKLEQIIRNQAEKDL